MSGRLVAMMSFVRPRESKPSIWFKSCLPTTTSQSLKKLGSAVAFLVGRYLHQRALDLAVRAGALREPASADGVDFVHEDDAGFVVARVAEHLAHHARGLADVLVHDGGGDHLEKVGLERRGDGAREQRFARSGWAVEEHAFGGLDADALEELGIEEGEFDDLL